MSPNSDFTSYWIESARVDPELPLTRLRGSEEADVVIVGGGYTGLSAALHLSIAQPECRIVLLEGRRVGHGASGCNAGYVLPFINGAEENIQQLLDAGRTDDARCVYQASSAGIEIIEQLATTGGVDCDWESVAHLRAALTQRQQAQIEKEASLYRAVGVDADWVSASDLRPRVEDGQYLGALRIHAGGTIHPGKLALGVLDKVRAGGVRVYEESPVTKIEEGQTVTVHTALGEIRTSSVIIATNAYSPQWGMMRHRILPVHSYSIATAPLSTKQIESLDWSTREPLLDVRNFFELFRLTPDNRILFGGGDAFYYYGGAIQDHTDHPAYPRSERRFRTLFPTLADVPITHRWVGHVGLALDRVPTLSVSGDARNIFFAGGYSGHGVSAAFLVGRLLSELTMQKSLDSEYDFILNRRLLRAPPEPLTRLGFAVYKQYLRWVDSR